MKRITVSRALLTLAVFLTICAGITHAEEVKKEKEQRFSFGIEGWMVDGENVLSGGPVYALNTYELRNPSDMLMISVNADFRINKRLFVHGVFGFGDWDSGKLVDTDWDEIGAVWALSESRSEGDTKMLELDLFYRILGKENKKGWLDVGIGAHHLKNSSEYSDPFIVIEEYLPVYERYYGIWNINDLSLFGVKIILRGEVKLVKKIALFGSLGYLPFIKGDYEATRYPGTGFDEYEKASPDGSGYEVIAGVVWRPTKVISVELGYRILSMNVDGNEEPGSDFYGLHDDFELEYKGGYIKGSIAI